MATTAEEPEESIAMFQALTDCKDRERALFFLRGAGGDLSIAVNHFLTAIEQAGSTSKPSTPTPAVAVPPPTTTMTGTGAARATTLEQRSEELFEEMYGERFEGRPDTVSTSSDVDVPSKSGGACEGGSLAETTKHVSGPEGRGHVHLFLSVCC